MDAPNAPNPANPNAQDQFVDAVQGPTNQAQGPAIQNLAQVPAGQIPAQVSAVQIPVQGLTQVGQNIPVQPPPQPVPVQLAPAGMIVPTPQIIYQNWIGKKPEFSGKPEEDAESHLLSTRDWMEAHNFPEGDKVRHFYLKLIGEARLWYELLAPLDDDWPALQNKFRWQYSKKRKYSWTTVPCLEDIQIWWEYRHNRLLCSKDESGCGNAKLWRDADIGEF